jgi:hypothetical protein
MVAFNGGRRRHGELVAAVWPSSAIWFYQQWQWWRAGIIYYSYVLVQQSKMWPRVCPLSETVHELAARRGRRRKARPMEPSDIATWPDNVALFSFGVFRDVAMHMSAKKAAASSWQLEHLLGTGNLIGSIVPEKSQRDRIVDSLHPGSVETLNIYSIRSEITVGGLVQTLY